MAIDIKHWNARFLDHYKQTGHTLNMARNYGITVKPATPKIDEWYWKCIGVKHLTGIENQGNHNIFCDVLDDNGIRMKGARLELRKGSQDPVYAAIDKPDQEAGTNFPIWGETPSDVKVILSNLGGILKSDKANGFRINHPDEPGGGNTIGHHSFYVVWQLVKSDGTGPEPEPEPEPDGSNGDKIVQTQNLTFEVGPYQVDLVIVIKEK